MTTSAIGNLPASNGTSVLSTNKTTFGDNPFLKLLTEQLKNQTPLEPVNNESFMNQMASYTTMQEQRDLNTNLLKLLDYQGVLGRVQGLSEGSALLGKQVTYAGDGGNDTTGTVESVFVSQEGDVKLKLTGGKEIDLRAVLGISTAAAASANTPATTPPPTGSTGTGTGGTPSPTPTPGSGQS